MSTGEEKEIEVKRKLSRIGSNFKMFVKYRNGNHGGF